MYFDDGEPAEAADTSPRPTAAPGTRLAGAGGSWSCCASYPPWSHTGVCGGLPDAASEKCSAATTRRWARPLDVLPGHDRCVCPQSERRREPSSRPDARANGPGRSCLPVETVNVYSRSREGSPARPSRSSTADSWVIVPSGRRAAPSGIQTGRPRRAARPLRLERSSL